MALEVIAPGGLEAFEQLLFQGAFKRGGGEKERKEEESIGQLVHCSPA